MCPSLEDKVDLGKAMVEGMALVPREHQDFFTQQTDAADPVAKYNEARRQLAGRRQQEEADRAAEEARRAWEREQATRAESRRWILENSAVGQSARRIARHPAPRRSSQSSQPRSRSRRRNSPSGPSRWRTWREVGRHQNFFISYDTGKLPLSTSRSRNDDGQALADAPMQLDTRHDEVGILTAIYAVS